MQILLESVASENGRCANSSPPKLWFVFDGDISVFIFELLVSLDATLLSVCLIVLPIRACISLHLVGYPGRG
jgi:hypothetical protein